VRRKSYAAMRCSVAQALEVVGDPWTMLVVRDVFFGVGRFEELQRRLGIPRNTLSDRLERLVEHGVLERRRYQQAPDRHEYVLTRKGRALRPVLVSLMQWGDRWSGLDAAPVVLEEEGTGRPIDPVLVDRDTGIPLDDLRVRAVPGPGASPDTAPPTRAVPRSGSRHGL
jgi:DNA-binding HxlR family transcriptional regulator